MNCIYRTSIIGIMFFLACIGYSDNILARYFDEVPINREYSSPSKRFVLHIKPDHPEGYGGAECYLTECGIKGWNKKFPFTLSDALVLDDGTVAGYGYTLALDGHGGKYREDRDHGGDLVLMIIDSQGKVKVKEAYQRKVDRWIFTGQIPEPMALAIVADPANDKMIFITTYSCNVYPGPIDAAWRQFQISTGKPLGVFYPDEKMVGAKWLRRCLRVEPLPGTPLLLVQWLRAEWSGSLDELPIVGTAFALLDANCDPVWQLTLRDDYQVSGDESKEKQLSSWIVANSAILSVESQGCFDLYFAKQGKRVSFAVKQNQQGKCTVTEIERKDFTPQTLLGNDKGVE